MAFRLLWIHGYISNVKDQYPWRRKDVGVLKKNNVWNNVDSVLRDG